jgi:VanZ family protein
VPVIVALTGTFIASSIPGHRLPPLGEWNADKILHGIEYAVIGALLVRPLVRTSWGAGRAAVVLLVAICLASAWGALDELHQLFTPNRSCDWRDWLADTVGAFVGGLAYVGVLRYRARQRLRAQGEGAP